MDDIVERKLLVAKPRRHAIALLGLTSIGVASLIAGDRWSAAAKQAKKNRKSGRSGSSKKKNGKGKNQGKSNKQTASGNAGDVVRVAKKHKGAKYVWGGESPSGFDCSGFTWYCYDKARGLIDG